MRSPLKAVNGFYRFLFTGVVMKRDRPLQFGLLFPGEGDELGFVVQNWEELRFYVSIIGIRQSIQICDPAGSRGRAG